MASPPSAAIRRHRPAVVVALSPAVVVAPSSCGRRRPAVIVLRSSSLLRAALVVTLRRRPAASSPRCTVALPLPSPCSSAALLSGRPAYQAAISCIAFSLLRRRLALQSPCPCRRPAPLPPCYPTVLPIKPPSAALPSAAISPPAYQPPSAALLSALLSGRLLPAVTSYCRRLARPPPCRQVPPLLSTYPIAAGSAS